MTGEEYYNYRPDCEKTIKKYLNNADYTKESDLYSALNHLITEMANGY